jgi:hypothetical protein
VSTPTRAAAVARVVRGAGGATLEVQFADGASVRVAAAGAARAPVVSFVAPPARPAAPAPAEMRAYLVAAQAALAARTRT